MPVVSFHLGWCYADDQFFLSYMAGVAVLANGFTIQRLFAANA